MREEMLPSYFQVWKGNTRTTKRIACTAPRCSAGLYSDLPCWVGRSQPNSHNCCKNTFDLWLSAVVCNPFDLSGCFIFIFRISLVFCCVCLKFGPFNAQFCSRPFAAAGISQKCLRGNNRCYHRPHHLHRLGSGWRKVISIAHLPAHCGHDWGLPLPCICSSFICFTNHRRLTIFIIRASMVKTDVAQCWKNSRFLCSLRNNPPSIQVLL